MISSVSTRESTIRLFVVSAISLYVELLIIRWMSSEIRAFTVFRTFPLISCFVGLGVGMAIGSDKSYKNFPLALLAFFLMMIGFDLLGFSTLAFPSFSVFQWSSLAGLVLINAPYVVLMMLLMVILLALPFGVCVTIGSKLGVLFNQLETLPAYSYNILGAIAGGLIFQLLAYAGLSPLLMLIPPLVAAAIMERPKGKAILSYLVPIIVITPLSFCDFGHHGQTMAPQLLAYQNSKSTTFWSPYQKIDLAVFETKPSGDVAADKSNQTDTSNLNPDSGSLSRFLGLELSANHTFYQYLFNTSKNSPLSNQDLMNSMRKDYTLPFSFNSPKTVLLVGAGTGQNVSFAVANGATDIDAVEIDPTILKIGKKYNPDYASPYVHPICDDARHYFSQCKKKYDVIDFSTLDSHTVAGFGSSVRLDGYVYTQESVRKALSLLNDKGVAIITFSTLAPWTRARMYQTFKAAAGYDPLLLEGTVMGSIFVLGPSVANHTIAVPSNYQRVVKDLNTTRYLTDDWPYLYVQTEVFDYPYFLIVAEVLFISTFAARRYLFRKNDPTSWQMFFLGAAFMLLELHAISFLSLLYGSTWITSAAVINSILLTILLANILVIKLGTKISGHQPVIYLLLLASILVSYFIPAENILEAYPSYLSYPILTILTVLPMGVAALIFSSAFKKAPLANTGLAFNLFGAVIGGLLEYLSNYWGIRSLVLVSAVLYLLSYLCSIRKQNI